MREINLAFPWARLDEEACNSTTAIHLQEHQKQGLYFVYGFGAFQGLCILLPIFWIHEVISAKVVNTAFWWSGIVSVQVEISTEHMSRMYCTYNPRPFRPFRPSQPRLDYSTTRPNLKVSEYAWHSIAIRKIINIHTIPPLRMPASADKSFYAMLDTIAATENAVEQNKRIKEAQIAEDSREPTKEEAEAIHREIEAEKLKSR